MTIDASEIYPSAPIRLVAFEVRHPFSLRSSQDEAVEGFQRQLGQYPILEVEDSTSVEMGPLKARSHRTYRLLTRDRRTSITVKPTAVVLETSRYDGYIALREAMAVLLIRLSEDFNISGIERLGLRYWDEIRVPNEITRFSDFSEYITGHLLQYLDITETEPFAEFGAEVVEFLSRLELRLSDEHRIRLNFGAFEEGQSVHGRGPLAVDPVDTNQPYFLLDIDSFWEARSFEEYDADRILEVTDELHRPVRSLFETSITDRLRDQVLRKAP